MRYQCSEHAQEDAPFVEAEESTRRITVVSRGTVGTNLFS